MTFTVYQENNHALQRYYREVVSKGKDGKRKSGMRD
jgi:hypothetical protein